jgi:hypothetical protein
MGLPTDRLTDGQTDGEMDRQTDGHKDRWTQRQMDKQTDRLTERQEVYCSEPLPSVSFPCTEISHQTHQFIWCIRLPVI